LDKLHGLAWPLDKLFCRTLHLGKLPNLGFLALPMHLGKYLARPNTWVSYMVLPGTRVSGSAVPCNWVSSRHHLALGLVSRPYLANPGRHICPNLALGILEIGFNIFRLE
jgi:hypothetical protein